MGKEKKMEVDSSINSHQSACPLRLFCTSRFEQSDRGRICPEETPPAPRS